MFELGFERDKAFQMEIDEKITFGHRDPQGQMYGGSKAIKLQKISKSK